MDDDDAQWLEEALAKAPPINNILLPGYNFFDAARRTNAARKRSPLIRPVKIVLGAGTAGMGAGTFSAYQRSVREEALQGWWAHHTANAAEQRLWQNRHEEQAINTSSASGVDAEVARKEREAATIRAIRKENKARLLADKLEEISCRRVALGELRQIREAHRQNLCDALDRRDRIQALQFARERAYAGVGVSSSSRTPSLHSSNGVRSTTPSSEATVRLKQERASSAGVLRRHLHQSLEEARTIHRENQALIAAAHDAARSARRQEREAFRLRHDKEMEQAHEAARRENSRWRDLLQCRSETQHNADRLRAQQISTTRKRLGSYSPTRGSSP
jgi:hypothetical protein